MNLTFDVAERQHSTIWYNFDTKVALVQAYIVADSTTVSAIIDAIVVFCSKRILWCQCQGQIEVRVSITAEYNISRPRFASYLGREMVRFVPRSGKKKKIMDENESPWSRTCRLGKVRT